MTPYFSRLRTLAERPERRGQGSIHYHQFALVPTRLRLWLSLNFWGEFLNNTVDSLLSLRRASRPDLLASSRSFYVTITAALSDAGPVGLPEFAKTQPG